MSPAGSSTTGAALRRLPIAVCLVAVAMTASPGAQAINTAMDDVAVVVHPDTPVDSLTLSELRRVVLGDRGFWPASLRVTLLLRAPVAHERDVILKVVCQMTESQFRQHWISKVFRADTAVAPKIVYSSEMSVDMVARIPGAITFVDASRIGKNVKVLKIDGRAPRETGYVLR
jgi:ABC-type phosphate transport system substrate-binding protein